MTKEFKCELCNKYLEDFGFGECPECKKFVCCFSFWNNRCAECKGTDCTELKVTRLVFAISVFMILAIIFAVIIY